MIEWGKLLEALKLSWRHAAVAALVTAFLLFGPQAALTRLGVATFVSSHRDWLGLGFLVSVGIVVVHVARVAWEWIAGWLGAFHAGKARKSRLADLTPDEKAVLRGYIERNTRTQLLKLQSGVASALESAQIIYQAASVGDMVNGFAYNIQPWAWRYLKEHPELLALKPDEQAGRASAPRRRP